MLINLKIYTSWGVVFQGNIGHWQHMCLRGAEREEEGKEWEERGITCSAKFTVSDCTSCGRAAPCTRHSTELCRQVVQHTAAPSKAKKLKNHPFCPHPKLSQSTPQSHLLNFCTFILPLFQSLYLLWFHIGSL